MESVAVCVAQPATDDVMRTVLFVGPSLRLFDYCYPEF